MRRWHLERCRPAPALRALIDLDHLAVHCWRRLSAPGRRSPRTQRRVSERQLAGACNNWKALVAACCIAMAFSDIDVVPTSNNAAVDAHAHRGERCACLQTAWRGTTPRGRAGEPCCQTDMLQMQNSLMCSLRSSQLFAASKPGGSTKGGTSGVDQQARRVWYSRTGTRKVIYLARAHAPASRN